MRFHAVLALVSLILASCNVRNPFQSPQGTLYRPPPQASTTPSPTPLLPPTEPIRPTPTPPCTDNLTFQEDLTLPDGSQVTPGETLDKRWQVQNSGTCNWDQRYHMKLIAGPEMGAKPEQALFPARSGTDLTIRILFTAPNDPGTYRSAWQAYNPQGEAFGDPFFIEVVVQAP